MIAELIKCRSEGFAVCSVPGQKILDLPAVGQVALAASRQHELIAGPTGFLQNQTLDFPRKRSAAEKTGGTCADDDYIVDSHDNFSFIDRVIMRCLDWRHPLFVGVDDLNSGYFLIMGFYYSIIGLQAV